MALIRRCKYCSKKIDYYEQCECEVQAKRNKYKQYKKHREDNMEEKIRQRFYGSKLWIKCRDNRAVELLGIDWYEYYKTGKIVTNNLIMHHIEELSDRYDLGLVSDNLILLSDSNHKIIHKQYEKGKKDKENMQRILIECLNKFYEEFY